MKILLLGSGGREHALAHSLAASPLMGELFALPGTAGMGGLATRLEGALGDHDGIIARAKHHGIDLVVIGPEAPLVAGLADDLRNAGIACIGPSKAAARLEGSKAWARQFCHRHGIPQPQFAVFDNVSEATQHIQSTYAKTGCVIKADGLAGGKGVIVADTTEEALAGVGSILGAARFGTSQIIIEERLVGVEASLFALVDGTTAIDMGSAQDYKRIFDGNRGVNTGGMGAVSPAPALTDALHQKAWERIILPVVAGMKAEGNPYTGFLYCGLMLGDDGPQVIEFNVRFGDPEAQAILPRLQSDLLTALLTANEGGLGHIDLRFDNRHAVTVVMANDGYPDAYETGAVIDGLDSTVAEAMVFHSGTSRGVNGTTLATGGRVLAVTGLGASVEEARHKAYARTHQITWHNCFFRTDIGL